VVLDNYISRGTDVFLTCKQPDYLASVNQVRAFPQGVGRGDCCPCMQDFCSGGLLQQLQTGELRAQKINLQFHAACRSQRSSSAAAQKILRRQTSYMHPNSWR
jgi:hypothetical protein